MKKKILITTAMERSTRILLRSNLLDLLLKKYNVVIASPAEISNLWRDEFKNNNNKQNDIEFLEDLKKDGYRGLALLKHYGIDLILAAENNDVPAHEFDIKYQAQAIQENIPIVVLQSYIDMMYHPMKIIPDKYLCWGSFFKTNLMKKRSVLIWDVKDERIERMADIMIVDAMDELSLDVCGSIYMDDYVNNKIFDRNIVCESLEFDPKKLIFLYTPNGDSAEWVYKMADDYFACAIEYNAQIIIKVHPIRHFDRWIYNIVASKYPEVLCKIIVNNSYTKGTAMGVKDYADDRFRYGKEDSIQLGSLLTAADITCSCASTANVEGMVLDKPNIIYTNHWINGMKAREDIMNGYWNILGNLFKACDTAKTKDELIKYIRENLDNPAKHHEGRMKLTKNYFGVIDGKSSERVVNSINNIMEE